MASYTDLANAYIPEKTGGGKPDNPDYTIWMTEGLQLIINASPPDMLWLFETSETDAAEDGVDIGSNKILYVLRESDSDLIDSEGAGNDTKMLVECREVPAALRGRLQPGSGWMEEVSETDPVYYKLGKLIHILPSSASANTKVYWIKNPPTGMTGASDYLNGTSGVPSEVEPMVMSWCIYKGVSITITKLLTEQRDDKSKLHESLTDVNSSLSSGNSALGKISDVVGNMSGVIDKMEEKIDAFYVAKEDVFDETELWDDTNKRFKIMRDALINADSLITNDASDNVSDTNIALGKIAGLVDKSEDALGTSSDGDIKDALTNANTILAECELINDKVNEEIDNSKLLIPDIDSAMQKAITELDEAVVDTDSNASGSFATAITSMKNALAEYSTYQTGGNIDGVQGAINNAQGLISGSLPTSDFDAFGLIEEEELDVLQGVIQTAGSELQRAQSYIAEWQAASGVLGQEVQGFASEVQTRSAFVQAKSVVWQGFVATAQGYLAEIQGKLGIAQGHSTQVQSKLAVVQGYTGEIQSRIAHSGAFGAVAGIVGNEGQMRIQQLTATTQTAAHELNRASTAVNEINGLISAYGLDLQGIQQYVNTAQQWFQQSQGYIGEAQGHFAEVTSRLSLITSQLQEFQMNQGMLSAVYQEMMACQQKYLGEFTTGLQMLQAGTFGVGSKDDIKKVPTYTGIAE